MVMLKRNNRFSSGSLESINDDECIENIKIIDFGLANHQSELEKN